MIKSIIIQHLIEITFLGTYTKKMLKQLKKIISFKKQQKTKRIIRYKGLDQ